MENIENTLGFYGEYQKVIPALEQTCSFYLLLPLGMNGINGIISQESPS